MNHSYCWQGIDQHGKIITGETLAPDKTAVEVLLQDKNICLLKIQRAYKFNFATTNKITRNSINAFCRKFALLINANIPLVTALNILIHAEPNLALQELLQTLRQDIQAGNSLTTAFNKHSQYFNQLFCGLIYAGEQSGTLDIILQYLANYTEKTETQRRKIFKALFYPSCVLTVTLIVTAILLIFVIPQFKTIYAGFGAALPLYTQCIISLANFISNQGIYILGVIIALIIATHSALKYSSTLQRQRDRLVLKIPIMGKLLNKGISYRIFKTMAITFKAGIPIINTLNIATNIANNWVFKHALQQIAYAVTHGKPLHRALIEQNLFPHQITQLIAIAEEAGNLDNMLEKIALIYEEEIDHITTNLNNLLEPLIMVILGILIGSLIIGMYLPIFGLGKVI